ncbi:MAG TPA: hypothetical protein VHE80_11630 [Acidimicrobiales bacterium]|nr:hypothetical protein [Acidimicrobiales bacterium]
MSDRLAEMGARLRTLRSCFGSVDTPATPGAWSAAAYAYDEALVLAANSLQVRGAPEPFMVLGRRRLTEPERAQLEEALAESGVDIGVVRYLPRTDRALLALPSGRPASAPPSPPGPDRPASPRPHPPRSARSGRPSSARPAPEPRAEAAPIRRPEPEPGFAPRSAAAGGHIGRVAEEARRLRRRLAAYRKTEKTWPTKVAEWTAELDAYDDVILTLGDMVGVPSPLPPGAGRRLLFEDRVTLEQRLAEAGLDLIGR